MRVIFMLLALCAVVSLGVIGFDLSGNARGLPATKGNPVADAGTPSTDAGDSPQAGADAGQQERQKPSSAAARDHPSSSAVLWAYLIVPGLLLFVLHFVDSLQAYLYSRKVLNTLAAGGPAALTPERLQAAAPSGIPGTSRSIFTYGLLVILAVAIVHLLAFSDAQHAPEYADKILTVLAGSLSSVIGFYFGSKATADASAGAASPPAATQTVAGKITRINPSHGPSGTRVAIEGTGFGDTPGAVKFGSTVLPQCQSWTATKIMVDVPMLNPGKMDVVVNPTHSAQIVATDGFEFT
jgi:hypothetical protein